MDAGERDGEEGWMMKWGRRRKQNGRTVVEEMRGRRGRRGRLFVLGTFGTDDKEINMI